MWTDWQRAGSGRSSNYTWISIALMGCWLGSTDASAFLCSRTGQSSQDNVGSGPSTSWLQRGLSFTFQTDGTADIDGDAEFEEIVNAFEQWGSLLVNGTPLNDPPDDLGCDAALELATDLTFVQNTSITSRDVGYDFLEPDNNQNLIVFYDSDWPYAGNTLGVTTTTFNAATGEILDADIEFNATTINFGVLGESNKDDLMNTAVHEIGHFLGLAHSTVEGATMQATTQPGEFTKRSLSCDDRLAVVFKYPADAENGYCPSVSQTDASCGFCEPPPVFEEEVTVTVTGSNNDLSPAAACDSTSDTGWLVSLVLILYFGLWSRRRFCWVGV